MPVDWSRKRRERAAEYLALAENTSDMRVRTALLAMAQRWLEVSNETLNQRSYVHVPPWLDLVDLPRRPHILEEVVILDSASLLMAVM